MVDTFDLNQLLTLAQTIGIIGTMVLTLYFSRRQIQTMARDTETQVLNDIDERRHRVSELFIDKPEMIKVVADPTSGSKPEHVVSYYLLLIYAHAYHMRQRNVVRDNEWTGLLQWMKNAFSQGTIKKDWQELKMGKWFDPSFQNFVDNEIMASVK